MILNTQVTFTLLPYFTWTAPPYVPSSSCTFTPITIPLSAYNNISVSSSDFSSDLSPSNILTTYRQLPLLSQRHFKLDVNHHLPPRYSSPEFLSFFSFFFLFFFFFFFFLLFRATPEAYGGSQARGPVGATAAGLHHSHSNTRSKLHIQTTPQLTATLDP